MAIAESLVAFALFPTAKLSEPVAEVFESPSTIPFKLLAAHVFATLTAEVTSAALTEMVANPPVAPGT